MPDTIRTRSVGHPAQLVVGAFALTILAGTGLLSLPFTRAGEGGAPIDVALFTATNSVTLGGMSVVDPSTYWTPAGQAVILGLIQVGGIGIVTSASILFLLVARRVGLRGRMAAQTELHTLDLGSTRRLIVAIIGFALAFEALTTAAIVARLWLGSERSFTDAAWNGLFHGVTAFSNSGVSIFPEGMATVAGDPWILSIVILAVIAGGLGFPVWLELLRLPRTPVRWSLHTKLTLMTTGFLLAFGTLAITALEWNNPSTLGALEGPDRVVAGVFSGVMPRTAGFNVVDYGDVGPDTLLVTEMLMFAGGGSGSVAGGIKVTTFALLFLIVWAELRGDPEVTAFRRRVPGSIQRQALTIAVMSVNAVVLGALVMMATSKAPFDEALFTCIAAFSTAGLSIEPLSELNDVGRIIVMLLLFLGRVGPVTLGVALVLRERERLYTHPEERTLVG